MLVSKKTGDDLLEAAALADAKGRSIWQDAMSRFRKNRAAVISMWTLFAIVLFALFGGFLHVPITPLPR